MTVTVLEVEGWNFVGFVGVNTALSECEPGLSALTGPMAMPATTGTGAPRLADPSLNWTVPVALAGATCAMGITIPPNPSGRGTWITVSVVVVTVAPGAGDGDGVGVTTGVGDGVGVTTGVGDGVGLGVGVGDGDGDGVGVTTGVGVGVTTGVGVGVGVGVTTGVGVGVVIEVGWAHRAKPCSWTGPLADAPPDCTNAVQALGLVVLLVASVGGVPDPVEG